MATTADDGASPRRRALNRELIVTTAARVLDDVGLEGFNLRVLANSLGVRAGAIYRHVASKDELLSAVVDSLFDEYGSDITDADGGWQEAMRHAAYRHRALLRAHPSLNTLLANGFGAGPRWLARLESQLEVLRLSGFTPIDALSVCSAINDLVTGSMQFSRSYDPALWDRLAKLPAARFPSIVDVAKILRTGGDEQIFEAGLDSLLVGFEVVRRAALDAVAKPP